MTTMTRVQAEALTAFIIRVRADWRPAGVLAALEKASAGADVADVSRAVIALAFDPTVKTPGLLPGPGPHWRRPDNSMPSRRGDHDVPCPEHPGHVQPCTACANGAVPPPAHILADLRASLKANRPKPRTPQEAPA